jgi:hypothetical protein
MLSDCVKKTSFVWVSSAVGVGVCLASIWTFPRLGLSVIFPAVGGEDEFSRRFACFVVGVCPAFVLLGAWIGHAGFGFPRRWLAMWAGAVAGAALSFLAAHLLQQPIARLTSERLNATELVVAFYVAWVILAGLGAASLRRLG